MSRREEDTDMSIDGMGNIVLLNATQMKVYCRNGDLLRVVRHGASQGSEGSARFVSAMVDGAGNVVVVDQPNRRIVVLSAAGELVRFFGQHGQGELRYLTDVSVDGAGIVFVTDWVHDLIVVFSAAGGVSASLWGAGQGQAGSTDACGGGRGRQRLGCRLANGPKRPTHRCLLHCGGVCASLYS
jgi:hypothetical protein